MFIGYIRHYKSDKEITYIKIASIWSDLVARGMFISLIKSRILDSRLDILNHKIKFWILKFYSCKNLEIFDFGIWAMKNFNMEGIKF